MAQIYFDSVEDAVMAANKNKAATMVFYDFESSRVGTVERQGGYLLKDMATFYNCTAEEIHRIVKWHIDNPDQERGVNYS
jgi:hypothetical protein